MEQGGEISEGRENVSSMVENGQRYLAEKEREFEGIENIPPEVIAKAKEYLLALGV